MTRATVTAGNKRLTYWRTEPPVLSGPTILLLHGLGADHEGLLPLTAAWPNADVIAPDLPGFGRSEPLDGTHSLAAYARNLQALCAKLGLSDMTVVGHSLGATIALALAAGIPDRLANLVLFSPVTSGSGLRTWPIRAYFAIGSALPPAAARLWFLSRAAVYLSDRSTLVTHDRRLRRQIIRADYRTAALASPRAIAEICRSVLGTRFDALAARVRVPVVLVGGEYDTLASPETLTTLQAHLPRSEVRIIKRAGHLWPVEDPIAAGLLVAPVLSR